MVNGAKGDAEHFCGGEQYLMPALDDFFENMKDTTAENKCDCITDDADISALLNICILEIFFFWHPKAKLEEATRPTLKLVYLLNTLFCYSTSFLLQYRYLTERALFGFVSP